VLTEDSFHRYDIRLELAHESLKRLLHEQEPLRKPQIGRGGDDPDV
jgi:hypothetical protein